MAMHAKHKKILDEKKDKFEKKPEWKTTAREDYGLCYDVRGRFNGYGKDSGGDNRAVRNFAYTNYLDYLEQYVRGQYSRTVGSSEAWWNLSITDKFKKVYPNLVDEISESLQDREREIIDYMNESDTKKQLFMSLKDYVLLGFSFVSLSYDSERDKLSVKRIPFDKCGVIPSPKWDSISLSVDSMKTKTDIMREMVMNKMKSKPGKNVPQDFEKEKDAYKVYKCMIMETPYYDEKLKEEQIIRAVYITQDDMMEEPYYFEVMPYNKRSIVLLTNSNNPNDPITNAGMVAKIYAKVIELNEFKIQEKLTVLRHNSPPLLGRSDVIVDEARVRSRRPSDWITLDMTQANNTANVPPSIADSIVPLNTTLDPAVIFQHCITLDREIRATINVVETIASTSPPKGETATAWNIYSQEAQKVIQYATEDLENNHHRPIIVAISNILDSKDALTKISISDDKGNTAETEANDDIIVYKFTASTRYITNRRKLNQIIGTHQALVSTIGQNEQGLQDINDTYNVPELIAMVHELSGTDKKIIKSVDEVAELKEERAKMAEQMNQQAQQEEIAMQQATQGGAGGTIATEPTENLATSRSIPL